MRENGRDAKRQVGELGDALLRGARGEPRGKILKIHHLKRPLMNAYSFAFYNRLKIIL